MELNPDHAPGFFNSQDILIKLLLLYISLPEWATPPPRAGRDPHRAQRAGQAARREASRRRRQGYLLAKRHAGLYAENVAERGWSRATGDLQHEMHLPFGPVPRA